MIIFVRCRSEHTYASAIWYGMHVEIRESQCNATYLIDPDPEPTMGADAE